MQSLSERTFQAVNESTGAFDYIQRKFKSPLTQTNHIERKRALKELDEEIRSLGGVHNEKSVEMAEMSFPTTQPQEGAFGMPKKRVVSIEARSYSI